MTGIRDQDGKYYCRKCDKQYSTFELRYSKYDNVLVFEIISPTLLEFKVSPIGVFRYNIQLRVVDGTDSATFTLFDREAKNFVKKSAGDLHESYVARVNMLLCKLLNIKTFLAYQLL